MEASQSKSTYKDIDVINEETESFDPLERPTSARKRSANTGREVFELLEHQRGPESHDETPGESITRVQSFEERQLKKNGWWDLWGYEEFGSELLENNGAVARDHMANERTFLSWIRTSMAMATAGVGVTQLFKLVKSNSETDIVAKLGRPVGACLVLIGVICVLMGTHRFFRTQYLLKENRYPPAKLTVYILVFLVFSVSAYLFKILYPYLEEMDTNIGFSSLL